MILTPYSDWILWLSRASLIDSTEALPTGVAVVVPLSGQTSLAVLINSPEAGTWNLELRNPTPLGVVSAGGYTKDLKPTVIINSIVFRESDQAVDILYSAGDPDSDPVVSLFYSSEFGVPDGLLLASGLELGNEQLYSWDVSSLPDGDYFFMPLSRMKSTSLLIHTLRTRLLLALAEIFLMELSCPCP
jgi:hypothetical protein